MFGGRGASEPVQVAQLTRARVAQHTRIQVAHYHLNMGGSDNPHPGGSVNLNIAGSDNPHPGGSTYLGF